MTNEQQPRLTLALKSLRAGYIAAMVAGAPVCIIGLLVLGVVTFGRFNENGPIEFPEPTLLQIIVARVSLVAFIAAYLHTAFTGHRRKRRPWLPFSLLALITAIMALGTSSVPPDPYLTGPDWITIYLTALFCVFVTMIVLAAFTEHIMNRSSA